MHIYIYICVRGWMDIAYFFSLITNLTGVYANIKPIYPSTCHLGVPHVRIRPEHHMVGDCWLYTSITSAFYPHMMVGFHHFCWWIPSLRDFCQEAAVVWEGRGEQSSPLNQKETPKPKVPTVTWDLNGCDFYWRTVTHCDTGQRFQNPWSSINLTQSFVNYGHMMAHELR